MAAELDAMGVVDEALFRAQDYAELVGPSNSKARRLVGIIVQRATGEAEQHRACGPLLAVQ